MNNSQINLFLLRINIFFAHSLTPLKWVII